MAWKPHPEKLVSFEPGADRRYLAQIEALRRAPSRDEPRRLVAPSGYAPWPHLVGRGKYGEFPLIVVREYYRGLGYTVWFCEPALEKYQDPDLLVSCSSRIRAGGALRIQPTDACRTSLGRGPSRD